MNVFTWDNFDEEFIISVVYSEKTQKELRPKKKINDKDMLIPTMDRIAPYPTKEFVIKYREEIETEVLKKYPEITERVYERVANSHSSNYLSMLSELSTKPLGTTMISSYITALSEIGSGESLFEYQSKYNNPISIDLRKSIYNEIPLYDFQEDAIDKLYESVITNNEERGLLVMPTGSGKTRTAVYFLLKNMASRGYQIIWLTHRHMLIDQTADAFYNFAPLIKSQNPAAKKLDMVCVSGEHSSIKATKKNDDIMIIGVQSGFRNIDYLNKVLAKKIIIVVDEAHHTVAMSYLRIINYIRERRKDVKLLGLTATPIRGTDSESKFLMETFDSNIIYHISMSELITKQILATPVFENIETDINFEPVISMDEAKLIKRYGEIPPTLANKIAQSTKRNEIIVDTYIRNKERYGKTLIFALNGIHCYTLCKDLQKAGIKCDYIYSGNSDNEEKIRRFKENEIDVLVNINILTEGSDVPDIQTIFLTRPTQSEGLLMQMIGRGMRGTLAGGTDEAIIVDFNDKWDTFNKWLNPKWLVDEDIVAEGPGTREYREIIIDRIPWDLVGDIYSGINFEGEKSIVKTLTLPAGWYPLVDNEGEDYKMLVFEEQLPGFKKLKEDLDGKFNNFNMDENKLINQYFGGFEMPPNTDELKLFLDNWQESNEFPQLFTFEERNNIDPIILVANFKEQNVGLADLEDEIIKIFDQYKNIIEDIYGDYNSYYNRIMDCIRYDRGIRPVSSTIEEIPIELIPFRLEATYDLQELYNEVVDEMFDGEYEGIQSIEWTDKPYKSFYGKYFVGGRIRINCLLNSPDAPRETVKFVIYHELLHRDYWYHDREFYRQEHKYPDYTEHNRFLDYGIDEYKFEW